MRIESIRMICMGCWSTGHPHDRECPRFTKEEEPADTPPAASNGCADDGVAAARSPK
jgi:hypothetical protein